jgi:hypothetical protein
MENDPFKDLDEKGPDFDNLLESKGRERNMMQRHETIKICRITSDNDPDKGASQMIQRIVTDNIRTIYDMGKLIGSGNFGTVRLATPFTNPNKQFAIKSIPREKLEDELELFE